MSKPWSTSRFLRFSLLWLFLSALWTALLSIVLPAMADNFSASGLGWGRGSLLAVFSAVGALVSAGTQVVVGWWSDHDASPWRRWRYLLMGFPLTLLPLLLLSFSGSPLEVLGALVLLQLLANAGTGPYQALIPDEVPAERHGVASTWMGVLEKSGQILGPILCVALLGEKLQGLLELSFVLYGGLLVGLAALWSALPVGASSVSFERQPPSLLEGLKRTLGSDPRFRLVLQSRLVINVGFYLVVYFLLFFVQYSLGHKDPAAVTGQMLGCMVCGGIVGGLLIGPRADKGRKLPLIYLTCAITGVGMAGFVAMPASSTGLAYVFAGVAGFGFGGFSVVDWSLACNLAPRASSALSMGVWNLAAVLPQVIAPGLFGPLSDTMAQQWGAGTSYRIVMLFVILFLALGCLRLSGLSEDSPKES